MTDETPTLDTALRRALEAADLATDAAEDLARLGRGNEVFVDRVTAAQRRMTGLAIGAAAGALVALALATLVYFRAVGNLQDAAAMQAETARVIAEDILSFRRMREEDVAATHALLEQVQALPARMDAAIAAIARETPDRPATDGALEQAVGARVDAARDEILAALAEVQLGLPPEAAPDLAPDLAAALARIEAGLLRVTAAPATPVAAAPARAPSAKPAAAPAPRPRVTQSPPSEPNPFAYP
ncbi:MAG: hypothetical protein RIR62_1066 [Pseudomonadota bacterium]